MKRRVYLSYPYSVFKRGDIVLDRIKRELIESGFEVHDPYERAGVGTSADIALSDLKAIESSDMVVVYMPNAVGGYQTGMELMYAHMLGKEIVVYTPDPDMPFLNWLSKNGVRIVPCESYSKCWKCSNWFMDSEYCDKCGTFICPECGTCLCKLDESTRRAIRNEIVSLYAGNPKKKRAKGPGARIVECFYERLKEMGVVENINEVYRNFSDLVKRYRELYEECVKMIVEYY